MTPDRRPRTIIELFTRHPNASNLLLISFIFFGLFGLSRLNTQFFPTVTMNAVTINVMWPGAAAGDIDRNVVETIQSEVRFIEGVKELSSKARSGIAMLTVEFRRGTNMQKAKSEVEAAVNQITTLPKDSERPIIAQTSWYEDVISVLVTGPFDERAIKSYAKDIRDGLLEAGVDRVTFEGLRDEEIWVEVRPSQLRRYDMTAGQIAARISESSLDVPGGVLRGDVERQVRAVGLALDAGDVGEIELRANPDGSRLLVRDVAHVHETFDANEGTGWSGENRAIRLNVMRTESSDSIKTS
jgi:multidrug efflux pump subunit AcrB